MRKILIAILFCAGLYGQGTTPGAMTRQGTIPASCKTGSSNSILYNNAGTDEILTCDNTGHYSLPPGGSTSTLTASGVGASGAAGANKLTGPASSIITTDSSGNGSVLPTVTGDGTLDPVTGALAVSKLAGQSPGTLFPLNLPAAGPATSTGSILRPATIPDYLSLVWPTNALSYGNGTTNSIASTITAFGSSSPNVGMIPPGYPTTETLPGESVLQNTFFGDGNLWGSPCQTSGNILMQDLRYQSYRVLCNGIGNNGQGGGVGLVGLNDNIYYDNPIIPNGHYNGEVVNVTIGGGGNNFESSDGTVVDKSTYNGLSMAMQVATSGQTFGFGDRILKTGLGDSSALNAYSISYGGCPSRGDECIKAINAGAIQGNSEFTGTIVGTPAQGATSITVAPTSGAPFQGQDRELINMTTGVTGLTVTAITNSNSGPTVLTTSGVAASVTKGGIGGSSTARNTPTVFTPTFTTGAITSITTSTPLCVVDGPSHFERVKPSAVNAGAGTVTLSFNNPVSSSATFSTGGGCGYDVVMTIDNKNSSSFPALFSAQISGTLHFAIPVTESSSTSVSLFTAGIGNQWFTYSGPTGISQWDAVTNNTATLYPAATVHAVNAGGTVSNNWILFDNNITWSASDTLAETQYFAQKYSVGNFVVQQLTPSPVEQPLLALPFYGEMGPQSLGIDLNNQTPMSYYNFFTQPIAGVRMKGAWNAGLYMAQEPGSVGVDIHCLVATCATGTYPFLRAWSGSTGTAFDTVTFDKANQQWDLTAGNRLVTYAFGKNGFTSPKDIFTASGAAFIGPSASGETVTFSATPTFSINTRSSVLTLTAPVTSFTLAAGQDGQQKVLTFCQNGTGSFTVAAPANVHGLFTVGATASKCNTQSFTYSTGQTAWLAETPGVTNQ